MLWHRIDCLRDWSSRGRGMVAGSSDSGRIAFARGANTCVGGISHTRVLGPDAGLFLARPLRASGTSDARDLFRGQAHDGLVISVERLEEVRCRTHRTHSTLLSHAEQHHSLGVFILQRSGEESVSREKHVL